MNRMSTHSRYWKPFATLALIAVLTTACASVRGPYTTRRDKTGKGAGIGAAAGVAAAILDGKTEADEILARAAIGAAAGAGVGAYLDAQEEKLARIPGTSVERIDGRTLLVHFESDVLFAIDSASLNPNAQGSLNEVATVLNDFHKTAVIVQGHTDATGSETHNQTLSERRAGAVQNHLIARGVAPVRITAIGYGESSPIASNASDYGRQQNRRVDIMLRANVK